MRKDLVGQRHERRGLGDPDARRSRQGHCRHGQGPGHGPMREPTVRTGERGIENFGDLTLDGSSSRVTADRTSAPASSTPRAPPSGSPARASSAGMPRLWPGGGVLNIGMLEVGATLGIIARSVSVPRRAATPPPRQPARPERCPRPPRAVHPRLARSRRRDHKGPGRPRRCALRPGDLCQSPAGNSSHPSAIPPGSSIPAPGRWIACGTGIECPTARLLWRRHLAPDACRPLQAPVPTAPAEMPPAT